MQGCHPYRPCLQIWVAGCNHDAHGAVHLGQLRAGHTSSSAVGIVGQEQDVICKITIEPTLSLCSRLDTTLWMWVGRRPSGRAELNDDTQGHAWVCAEACTRSQGQPTPFLSSGRDGRQLVGDHGSRFGLYVTQAKLVLRGGDIMFKRKRRTDPRSCRYGCR